MMVLKKEEIGMKYKKSTNGIGAAFQALGWIIVGLGVLISFGTAMDVEIDWLQGIVLVVGCLLSLGSGLGLIAIAEALNLLQTSCDMEYKILCRLNGTEDTPDSGEHAAPTHEEMKKEPIPSRKIPAAAPPAAAPTIQFCPHCGAKQSSPAAKCWHCGGTLSGR